MKYMLMIYMDPNGTAPEGEMEGYFSFTDELMKAGKMVAGDPLQGVETATTVTVDSGKTVTTDGPFAETKEILGGYYIVDVDDIDEAIGWAAKIPTATWGKIEVRPLMDLPPMA